MAFMPSLGFDVEPDPSNLTMTAPSTRSMYTTTARESNLPLLILAFRALSSTAILAKDFVSHGPWRNLLRVMTHFAVQ